MTVFARPPPSDLADALIQASSDGMVVFDREFRYVLWNAAMERISGMPAEDVLGKCAFDVFPFLVESGEDELFRKVLSGQHVTGKERPFLIEGTKRSGYFDAEYRPWQSASGEILGGIGIIRDVTESRRKEQRVAESETRFQNMADVAPVLLWMSRPDGLCTFFNQTWLEFTGRSLAEEWGVGWAELVHFEDFQSCMDTYVEAFGRREVFEMEYRLKRKDGEYRWLLDRGTPRYTPDGTFAGYIGSCADITDIKHLEQELRQAVRERDEFLSIASHELRTPLTALQLQLESLQHVISADAGQLAKAERIARNAAKALQKALHLTQMVNVLLDVSHISEGRLVLTYENVDIAELVTRSIEGLKEAAAAAQCAISLQIDAKPIVRCDGVRIDQVLTNLLTNAFKYAPNKPVEINVALIDERVVLRVTDHGPGIKPEHQAHVFDRYTRFASIRNYSGFGLGLWITHEIVRAHGGQISVQSELGQGATFIIELPLKPPPKSMRPGPP